MKATDFKPSANIDFKVENNGKGLKLNTKTLYIILQRFAL